MLRVASLLVSVPILVILLAMAALPLYGPRMGYIEGSLMPVTSQIEIVDYDERDDGIYFRFVYEKNRLCEITGVGMYADGQEIGFDPTGDQPLNTLGSGRQVSRLWHVERKNLEGAQIWFYHRCHPFWITATRVYG